MERGDAALLPGAQQGAERILTQCLSLTPGENLTLFWDETTEPIARLLLATASQIGVRAQECFVSVKEQRAFRIPPGLDQSHLTALEDARGILTCLTDDISTTNFRFELVTRGTNADRRLGHLPGATLEMLAYAGMDHLEAERHCEELALAMSLGRDARLVTYELDESSKVVAEHELFLDLGGLDRAPITSTGIIPLDTWGNIPGAETFIAPWEGSAHGTFVLNGSFSGNVIAKAQSILLSFEEGHLVGLSGDKSLARKLSRRVQAVKNGEAASNRALAELGVGVNSTITRLTGKSLIDEKCAGTAHIALGDSKRYGGRNASKIHEDLITVHPTLIIDGKEILRRGVYAMRTRDWNPLLSETALTAPFCDDDFEVSRTGLTIEVGPPLKVRREVAQGRIGVYAIGEPEDADLLSALYKATHFLPDKTTFRGLCAELGAMREKMPELSLIRAGLQLLVKHRVLSAHSLSDTVTISRGGRDDL